MVLRSVKDGRCLGAVSVFYDEIGNDFPVIVEFDRPSTEKFSQRYQIIFPVRPHDHSIQVGKKFKFVITNKLYYFQNQREVIQMNNNYWNEKIIDLKGREITENEFTKSKGDFQTEKHRLEGLLIDTEKRADNWLDNAEKYFDFA